MKANNINQRITLSSSFQGGLGENLWSTVLLKSGASKTGHIFTKEFLKNNVAKFDKIPIFLYKLDGMRKHLNEDMIRKFPNGIYGNLVGWTSNTRYQENGEDGAIVSDVKIIDSVLDKTISDSKRDAEHLQPGLSVDIDAFSRTVLSTDGKRYMHVYELRKVRSADIVDFPAGGGKFVKRITQSCEKNVILNCMASDLAVKYNVTPNADEQPGQIIDRILQSNYEGMEKLVAHLKYVKDLISRDLLTESITILGLLIDGKADEVQPAIEMLEKSRSIEEQNKMNEETMETPESEAKENERVTQQISDLKKELGDKITEVNTLAAANAALRESLADVTQSLNTANREIFVTRIVQSSPVLSGYAGNQDVLSSIFMKSLIAAPTEDDVKVLVKDRENLLKTADVNPVKGMGKASDTEIVNKDNKETKPSVGDTMIGLLRGN